MSSPAFDISDADASAMLGQQMPALASPAVASSPGGAFDISDEEAAPLLAHMDQTVHPTFKSEALPAAASFVRGTVGLGDLAAKSMDAWNLMQNPMPLVQRAFGGTDSLTPLSDFVQSTAKRDIEPVLVTAGTPQTAGGRMASTVAEYAPGAMLAGPEGAVPRIASALGMGGGAAVARETLPGNPLAEIAASLFGASPASFLKAGVNGIKSTYQGVARLLSEQGAREAAAKGLQEAAGADSARLASVLTNTPDVAATLPGNATAIEKAAATLQDMRTPAEITQNPGLASVEMGVGRKSPLGASLIGERDLAKQDARDVLTQGNVPEQISGLPAQERGSDLRSIINEGAGQQKTLAQALYTAADPQGAVRIPIMETSAKDVASALSDIAGPGAAKLRGDAKDVVQELWTAVNKDRALPIAWSKNMAARAANVADQIQSGPQAAGFKRLAGILSGLPMEAAQAGEGLTGPQANSLQAADALWRQSKGTFETGAVGRVTNADSFGRPFMDDSSVASSLLAKPESVDQTLAATLGPRADEAKQLLMGKIVQDIQTNKPPTPQTGKTFERYVQANAEQIKKIDPEHYDNLQKVVDSLQSERSVRDMAFAPSRGQSATAQLNTAQYIKQQAVESLNPLLQSIYQHPISHYGAGALGLLGGGWVGGLMGMPGIGRIVGGAGGMVLSSKLHGVVDAYASKVEQLLTQAAFDKNVAAELLRAPTPERVTRVISSLGSDLKQTAVGALINSLQPEPPRNGTDTPGLATQPQAPVEKLPSGPGDYSITKGPNMDSKSPDFAKLVSAIKGVEDPSGDPNAISKKGAVGVMQLMPATAKTYHDRLGIKEPLDLKNAAQNEQIGTAFLKDLVNKYPDIALVAAAYNTGETNLDAVIKAKGLTPKTAKWSDVKAKLADETQKYAPAVLKRLGMEA